MTNISSKNPESKGKDSRGGWDYWIGILRSIFTGEEAGDELRGSKFTNTIVDCFKAGYVLEDNSLGRWFATLEAVEATEKAEMGEFEARFLLSREPRLVPEDVWVRPVHQEIHVTRNYNEQLNTRTETLVLFFSFSDVLPIRQNLNLFRECAISRLRNLQQHPLRYELEMEESAAGAAGAD